MPRSLGQSPSTPRPAPHPREINVSPACVARNAMHAGHLRARYFCRYKITHHGVFLSITLAPPNTFSRLPWKTIRLARLPITSQQCAEHVRQPRLDHSQLVALPPRLLTNQPLIPKGSVNQLPVGRTTRVPAGQGVRRGGRREGAREGGGEESEEEHHSSRHHAAPHLIATTQTSVCRQRCVFTFLGGGRGGRGGGRGGGGGKVGA